MYQSILPAYWNVFLRDIDKHHQHPDLSPVLIRLVIQQLHTLLHII